MPEFPGNWRDDFGISDLEHLAKGGSPNDLRNFELCNCGALVRKGLTHSHLPDFEWTEPPFE